MDKYNIEERKKYYQENREFYKEAKRSHTELFADKFNEIATGINELKIKTNANTKPIELIDVDQALEEYADACVNMYKYNPTNASEEVNGINIHEYLEAIRYNDYESAVFLAIKDGNIVDSITVTGGPCQLNVQLYSPETIEFAKKHSDCKLFTVHNHPRAIAAVANGNDYNAILDIQEDWNKEFPAPEIIDWGVVTQCDYYSFKQCGNNNLIRN